MTLATQQKARSATHLFREYSEGTKRAVGEKLVFDVAGRDVYNITAPFLDAGDWIIAGRVEPRESEVSDVLFFEQQEKMWIPHRGTQPFRNLQDPFVTKIRDEIIFGGVEVWPNYNDRSQLDYRTVFYRGPHIHDLHLFSVGPQWMKDIRLVELKNGLIGIFTRPNGPFFGGNAQIGFTTINRLNELTPEVIINAGVVPNLFVAGEWGGVNEPHVLRNGLVGVVGHISYLSEEKNLHYYAMSFVFDPDTHNTSPLHVIASKQNFPHACTWKRKDLDDVIFSGGLVRKPDGSAELYVGVSDSEAHKVQIPDPFADYEKENC